MNVEFRLSTQLTGYQRSLYPILGRAIAQAYNHSDRSGSNYRIIIEEIDRIVNGQKMAQITTTELPQTLQTLFIEVERTLHLPNRHPMQQASLSLLFAVGAIAMQFWPRAMPSAG